MKTNSKKTRQLGQTGDMPMILGKIPPQAVELEMAIIGAIMLERDAFSRAHEVLKQAEVFYKSEHQTIYKAIQRLVSKNQPVDTLTVMEELRSSGELELIGGPFYLTKLTKDVVSSAHIEGHSSIVHDRFVSREIIRISGLMLSAAYEDTTNPHDLLEEAEESLQSIGMEINVGAMTHISSVVKQAIEKIEYYRTLETDITGVPSGFQALDKATRGWQPGDLIILGARPSVGKTAFALNLIKNAAESKLNGKRLGVAVWSLEMKAWSLMMRMISAKSKKNLRALQTGRIGENEMAQVYNFASELGDLDIYFNDDSGVTTQNIKIKARRMKRRGNLGLIVIDYLQLISGTGDKANGSNREQEVSKISRDLKLLAQELEVPIIALSQLSRDVEKRSGPAAVPKPSDLRESGSLEQDADLIMFLFSPSESEIMDDPSLDNVRRVKIAKQRNGHLDTVSLRFEDHLQLFSTIEDNNPELPAGNWRGVTPTLF